jgi:hypothetical protein
MADERQMMFVIAFGTSSGGSAPPYLAPDGTRTDTKARAAKFYSFETAQQFAAHCQISLLGDGSIGEEMFNESELESGIVTPDDFL